jgi:uncharacterized membrane protein YqiK
MMDILVMSGIILAALIVLGLIFARLYKRASKEVSFVRTGFSGQKVVMNGGALVFPVLHEVIPVNMNTLRLSVRRANEQALITRDRMRVDAEAEFFVRVKPAEESIAAAAQTLGMRTMNPEQLKELIEGKFVDSLRAVAAEMKMEEMHEQRTQFVQSVQTTVAEDLLKNGLELESVSLTGLDQTSREFFNPNNAFDAEGLTRLTEEIEARRKLRNDIEQDTEVEIKDKNLEAERKRLEISRDEEYARLQQEREIEIRRASQIAEIAREQALKQREAEEAQIVEKQKVDTARILSDRAVEEEQIRKELTIKEADIAREKAVEIAQIEQKKAAELADQDKQIAIAEKSREQSEAQAEADVARQKAVKEAEQVQTVRDTAIAERSKEVELVKARESAEQQAIRITVAAEAEKQAAEDNAESVRIMANAEAEQQEIQARGEAEAIKLKADADERRYEVDAQGKQAINQAANTLSEEQIAMQVKLELMRQLPDIIRESVKPMEQIDGIKIFQMEGFNTGGGSGPQGDSQNISLADQVVNSALRYRGQAPLVDALLQEVGIDGTDINKLTGTLQQQTKNVSDAGTDKIEKTD